VNMKLFEVGKPDKPLRQKTVKVIYPKEAFEGTGPVGEVDPREVDTSLMELLIDDIAKIFYVHDAEKKKTR
jgi:hypothetical protein